MGDELEGFVRVSSYCSTSDTLRVNLLANLVISYEKYTYNACSSSSCKCLTECWNIDDALANERWHVYLTYRIRQWQAISALSFTRVNQSISRLMTCNTLRNRIHLRSENATHFKHSLFIIVFVRRTTRLVPTVKQELHTLPKHMN